MKRREFIALLGGAAVAWPLGVKSQEQALPVVGFLNGGRQDGYALRAVPAFRQGLSETGYIADVNVKIEYHWAEGHYACMIWLRPSTAYSTATAIGGMQRKPMVRIVEAYEGSIAHPVADAARQTAEPPVETGLLIGADGRFLMRPLKLDLPNVLRRKPN